MTNTFKEKCKEFIELLAYRSERTNFKKYNEDKWYKGAYSTVQRIMPHIVGDYKKWKAARYEGLKKDILDLLKSISPKGSKNVNDALEEIAKKHNVSMGVAQKIFNIFAKYIITNYWGGFDPETVGKLYPWVKDENFVRPFSVPVDGVILKRLKKASSKLKITNIPNIEGKPWSKIDRDIYEKVQAEVRNYAISEEMFPLEYEMRKLWNVMK